jgi:hypothetical protein
LNNNALSVSRQKLASVVRQKFVNTGSETK